MPESEVERLSDDVAKIREDIKEMRTEFAREISDLRISQVKTKTAIEASAKTGKWILGTLIGLAAILVAAYL
ncbi:MAG: hypothetical protein AAF441_21290 [Pseudomonadota bacterium]